MPKYVCLGGQKREIQCTCGHLIIGDVRTTDFKLKIHLKVCNDKEIHKKIELPSFDKSIAKVNGKNDTQQNRSKPIEICVGDIINVIDELNDLK